MHLETRTMNKETICFLQLRQQSQKMITKLTAAPRNKRNLTRLLDCRHLRLRFRRPVSPRRARETACCTVHRWAFRSSTPPTSCWRLCRAPWSFCRSQCSSWQRLSRSLCASRCSSSGRRCRCSETSQVEPSHSCMTNWMDGRHYNSSDTWRCEGLLSHWRHTWPSGAGTSRFFWTSPVVFKSADFLWLYFKTIGRLIVSLELLFVWLYESGLQKQPILAIKKEPGEFFILLLTVRLHHIFYW